MPVDVQVLLFAGLREYYGGQSTTQLQLEKDVWDSCSDLKEFLLHKLDEIYHEPSAVPPSLSSNCRESFMDGGRREPMPAESIMLAINEQYVYDIGQFDNQTARNQLVLANQVDETNKIKLRQSDKIALIHPVTGG